MPDNQYYDVKPKSWDGAVLFNDLINVRPVPAPRTWMWTRYNDIVEHSDNGYYFFRKRKWTKYVKTYRVNWNSIKEDTFDRRDWADNMPWRLDWEFTDMVIFEGNRYFMRTNSSQDKIRIYKQVLTNTDKYWKQCLSSVEDWMIVCLTDWEKLMEYDTTPTTYKRFLKTQSIWWNIRKLEARLRINTEIKWIYDSEDDKTNMFTYVLDLPVEWTVLKDLRRINYVYFNHYWFTAEVSEEVCDSVFNLIWMTKEEWHTYYFLRSDQFLQNFSLRRTTWCESVLNLSETSFQWSYTYDVDVTLWEDYWDSLSFITSDWIVTILKPFKDYSEWDTDINNYIIHTNLYEWFTANIISACMWNNRIAVLTDKWWLAIWWEWMSQFNFAVDSQVDSVMWFYNVWDRFTTIIPIYYTLVLAWPHETAYFMPDNTWQATYAQSSWLYTMSERIWIFSDMAYEVKDWKIFIVKSFWDVYMLEMSPNSYWYQSWNNTYYSMHRYTRLKDLVQWEQKINIDMTDNDMFVSIYEEFNESWTMWSIVLCEDRHYNIRYTWEFEWIKISRVLEWWDVLLWDCVYSMNSKYLTDQAKKEHIIKEVIDIIFWDETPNANKHFMFYKLALWDNSRISNKTWLTTNVVSSWRLRDRTVNITNTRYASMLTSKNSNSAIRKWDFWYEILWHWERYKSSFERELQTLTDLEKLTIKNPRVGYTTSSWLWLYSSIKESIWQEWELLQITLTSLWTDDLEFWSCLIWWFAKDYDFSDIEDVNVDSTEFTSDSESEWHIQKEFNTH